MLARVSEVVEMSYANHTNQCTGGMAIGILITMCVFITGVWLVYRDLYTQQVLQYVHASQPISTTSRTVCLVVGSPWLVGAQ